ncbi:sensor histidine kinase [Modestobacter sp. I12A-02628]|uniref:histidine kinase n=1 Tax=Goekera deserti TaxID=2497753 RepID=A0A7K3WE39_9ACTN|nr:histidine kinase [Goekera deserti]MPQ99683.1 sensor histidine kinase [Goekera deserti]NDI46307.1 sensor histidine kinase [Goekera deserti]NEL54761.1 sensor histidine kinase [Goekera deserti]
MELGTRPPLDPAAGVEHPWLVPAHFRVPDTDDQRPPRGGGPVRRSGRDRAVDLTAVLSSLLGGLLLLGASQEVAQPPSEALVVLDLTAGVVGCLALWGRRRWPVGVAVALLVLSSFSNAVGVAALFALFTVAVHRRWPTVLAVSAVSAVSGSLFVVFRPDPDVSGLWMSLLAAVLTAGVVAWGMFVRARRQLVLSLVDRARRAERERDLRVEQARHTERTRIAREMHDVLAHRISLLGMHAGALEYRPDAPPEEVARAAGVIRASARQAMDDLREVIGVLRDDTDGTPAGRPQPTLADVPTLVEESRQAGMRVELTIDVPRDVAAPEVIGRTAYRVVQEALTNVRKHAGGTVAAVHLSGRPGPGLTVDVVNPPVVGAHAFGALPSAGTGLVGVGERVGLAGGTVEHGWTAEGRFRLRVWLPWAA